MQVGKAIANFAKRMGPISTAAIGVEALGQLAPVGKSLISDPLGAQINEEVQGARLQRAAMAKMQRMQTIVNVNTERLKAVDPHTYTEIMAGRRLARGSTVVGGQKRLDLMEMLAMQMGEKGENYLPQQPGQ